MLITNEVINAKLNHKKWADGIIYEEREINIEGNPKLTISGKTYTFGDKATGVSPLSKVIIPWNFTQLVDLYANSVAFCTETLRHIKNQNYKDDATIQYEDSRKQTKKAIKISLWIGIGSILVGVFFGGLTYCQNERHYQRSISRTQTNCHCPQYHNAVKPTKPTNCEQYATNDSLKSIKTLNPQL